MIYQRVLVPVSGKNSGERAAKALRHAKTLCSGEIILLHVTEALPNLVGGAAHTELERSNTAKAETLLAPLADMLIGSITERVLRNTDIPLLAVRR